MDGRGRANEEEGMVGPSAECQLQFMERGELNPPPRPSMSTLMYRPLKPSDQSSLQWAHRHMFPIDYEDAFYERAVNAQDNIVSWVAVAREEELVGFVTARLFRLQESDMLDRTLLHVESPSMDNSVAMYILTIGVVEEYRKLGIATGLLQRVIGWATEQACVMVYLHVITYNHNAIAFYQRNAFTEVALLPNFYFIGTGRQPNPSQQMYDAYLYVKMLGQPPQKYAWPYDLLSCATLPLRRVGSRLRACLWWLMSWPPGTLGFAAPPGGRGLLFMADAPAYPERNRSAWPMSDWLVRLFSRRRRPAE